MAKGKPSDLEDCVIRSGVRSGLKREFAFALKSQAELSPSLGRTRSGKFSPSPSTNPNPNPNSPISLRHTKRFKRSPSSSTLASPILPPNGPDAELQPPIPDLNPKRIEEDASARPMEEEEPEPVVENPLPAPLAADQAHGGSEADSESSKVVSCAIAVADANDGPREENNEQKEDSGGSVIDMAVDLTSAVDSFAIQSKAVSQAPADKLKDSVFTTPPVQFTAHSVETPVGTPVRIEDIIMEKPTPTRRFTRSLLKAPENIEESSQVESPIVVNVDQGGPKDGSSLLAKFGRRFTRSLLKAPEDATLREVSATVSSGSVGSDEMKGGANAEVESSSITSSKKLELKMSKKIALKKLPSNVRELLGTGLLEGLPVKYFSYVGKSYGLEGVITGNGILCSCSLCKGSKVVSAFNFEVHAGSTKKHPSDYIFLENGKSLRDVMRACTNSPLDMLESAIQDAVGAVPSANPSTCHKCKKSFHTPRAGKLALMCDSCLEPKQNKTIKRASQGTSNNAKLPIKDLAAYASVGSSKKTSSQKDLAADASYGPSKKIPSQKKSILAGDASGSMSKNSSSQKKVGKLTKKDLGLHKLVFMDDILPEGTEVGYYVCGKRLLDGYIKDSGIYCLCCNTVVSPSQFEAHAGRASRRKPYNNIYTSNGVSLHELSVSLSKGRKLSASENDDLCSICADGGNLLLCDLCPRAFHKECVGLSSIPRGDFYCRYCQDMHQREKCCSSNDNAIAAGRVAGVDPIEQIIKRSIRIVTTSTDIGGCVLCRCHDFSTSTFDNRTVIICDQCEKEYHVGCMKNHNMCDLKELPEGEWFCSSSCSRIHTALQDLLRESQPLEDVHADIIKKKHEEKRLNKDGDNNVRWRLLSGKTSPAEVKLLLSEAVSIFHESFDPIVDAVTGRDLIPSMVYGRNVRDQDFGGMYCAVLTVNSTVVSAGILRVLGCEVAELPLVATQMGSQGLGYFQCLFSCIEKLFESLKVKHFVLPSAEEAKSIWTKKFGFSAITLDQFREYTMGAHPIIFQGTTMLHKPVRLAQNCSEETQGNG